MDEKLTVTIKVDEDMVRQVLDEYFPYISTHLVNNSPYFDKFYSLQKYNSFVFQVFYPYLEEFVDVCSDEELQKICQNITTILLCWAKKKGLSL